MEIPLYLQFSHPLGLAGLQGRSRWHLSCSCSPGCDGEGLEALHGHGTGAVLPSPGRRQQQLGQPQHYGLALQETPNQTLWCIMEGLQRAREDQPRLLFSLVPGQPKETGGRKVWGFPKAGAEGPRSDLLPSRVRVSCRKAGASTAEHECCLLSCCGN